MRFPRIKSISLTIYLIKEGLASPDQFLSEFSTLTKHELQADGKPIGDFYLKPRPVDNTPSWLPFINQGLASKLEIKNRNQSGILLINRDGRTFALSFGYGRTLLVGECFEERFGLIVTLNTLEKDSIRSIDRQSFDALAKHTRIQTVKKGTFSDFGLDVEQDILKAVVGQPRDKTLGARISGMDALKVDVKVNLSDLPELLGRYLEKFKDPSYKTEYPWVEQLSEVKSSTLIQELDGKLVEKINGRALDRLWMAVPEIIDWSTVGGFRYSKRQSARKFPDIQLPDFMETLDEGEALDTHSLGIAKVHQFDLVTDLSVKSWSVYKCVYCEIDHDGNTYILNGGKWYQSNPDYVRQINDSLAGIRRFGEPLPVYTHQSEGEYNRHVADGAPSRFALMDGDNIPIGGGRSSVEFCDLFTSSKQLIHVKRYGSSSVLSHLFAQGVVSGTLLLHEAAFRRGANERLPATFHLANPDARPETQEYEVVFAIISNSTEPFPTLPFFSRINLRNAVQLLSDFRYNVSIAKIADERADDAMGGDSEDDQ